MARRITQVRQDHFADEFATPRTLEVRAFAVELAFTLPDDCTADELAGLERPEPRIEEIERAPSRHAQGHGRAFLRGTDAARARIRERRRSPQAPCPAIAAFMSSIDTGLAGLQTIPLSPATGHVTGTTSYRPVSSLRRNAILSPASNPRRIRTGAGIVILPFEPTVADVIRPS